MDSFRGELVFKAHRLLYRSTLGLRVIKKKKKAGFFYGAGVRRPCGGRVLHREREFFVDNLLVRIHFIILMILEDWPCAMEV